MIIAHIMMVNAHTMAAAMAAKKSPMMFPVGSGPGHVTLSDGHNFQASRRRIIWMAVFTTRSNASGSMTSMVSPVV